MVLERAPGLGGDGVEKGDVRTCVRMARCRDADDGLKDESGGGVRELSA